MDNKRLTTSNEKRRRAFELLDENQHQIALGIAYEEMNVQLHWRSDIGHTAENFSSIAHVLYLMPNMKYFKWID